MSDIRARKHALQVAIRRAKVEGRIPYQHWCNVVKERFGEEITTSAMSQFMSDGHLGEGRLGRLEAVVRPEGWLGQQGHLVPEDVEEALSAISDELRALAAHLVDQSYGQEHRISSLRQKLNSLIGDRRAGMQN